jgi:diphthamide biosynthesis protein 3
MSSTQTKTHTTTPSSSSTTTTLKATATESNSSKNNAGETTEEEEEIYDEVEIEDMTYDATLQIYHYPCPCGDRFEISLAALQDKETDVAVCPSCSLRIRVVYEVEDLPEEG